MRVRILPLRVALLAVAAIAGCTGPLPEDAADTIHYGGDIVTINDAQPTGEAQTSGSRLSKV